MMADVIARRPLPTRSSVERLLTLARHPAVLSCAAIGCLSVLILVISGSGRLALTGVENAVGFGLFALLTARLAGHPGSKPSALTTRGKVRFSLQICVLAIIFLLSARESLYASYVLTGPSGFIPLWTPLRISMASYEYSAHLPLGALFNPLILLVIPWALLRVLGTRGAEMGFGDGARVWRNAAIWCFAPLVVLLVGRMLAEPVTTLQRLLFAALLGGPFQEFFFRGALLTRLARLFGNEWGLVISSLAFGLWHLGGGLTVVGGQAWIAGGAYALLTFGVFGLSLGVLYQRTGNLVAPTLLSVIALAAF